MTDVPLRSRAVGDSERNPKRSLIIGVGALLGVLGNVVFVMLTPLLPLMQAEYSLGISETTWVFTCLTLATGASFVVFPRLADIYGDRLSAACCCGVMVVGAMLPALIRSYPALLIGSILLGLGGATQVLNLGLIRRHLTGRAVVIAVSVAVMASGVGAGAGFVVGGLALEFVSIVTFYYILAGVFALGAILVLIVVPPTRGTSDSKVGVIGTVWLIGWVTLLLLGFSMAPTWGYASWTTLGLVGAGLLFGVLWIRVERNSESAVFNLTVLENRSVSAGCIGGVMIGAVLSNTLLLVSYFAQTPEEVGYGLGLDALGTGIIFIPFAIAMIIGGYVGGKAVESGRALSVSIAGSLVAGLGSLWLAFANDQQWQFLIGTGIAGLGTGLAYAGVFALPQLVVSEEDAGMSAGLVGTAIIIGTSVGSALVTGILSSSSVAGAPGVPEVSRFQISFMTNVVLSLATTVVMIRAREPKQRSRLSESRHMAIQHEARALEGN